MRVAIYRGSTVCTNARRQRIEVSFIVIYSFMTKNTSKANMKTNNENVDLPTSFP